tara:strand:+ start:2687 stop:3226 length:540 start_codon:yes stop_codon:yes gene_type:complete
MEYDIISAVNLDGIIGLDNDLVYKISKDMKYFKDITSKTKDCHKKNAVVMGRKTWDSIPDKYKPLSNRVNCVITNKNTKIHSDVIQSNNFQQLIKSLSENKNIETIFIIGGSSIYNMAFQLNKQRHLYITKINHSLLDNEKCVNPKYFPHINLSNYSIVYDKNHIENNLSFNFIKYVKL